MLHGESTPQIEAQFDVGVWFAMHTDVHARSPHSVSRPQIDAQFEVGVPFDAQVA